MFLPRFVLALLGLALAQPAHPAERWVLRYFYDADDTMLVITDMQFTSQSRGMAVGYFVDRESGKQKPAGLVTTDGGRLWTPIELPKPAVSLFLLDEQSGWLVTRDTIWETREFGREWKRLKKMSGVQRVCFVDRNHGWATGERKLIEETRDGGRNWERVAAADEPKTARNYTTYSPIAFATPRVGAIAGWSKPPQSRRTWGIRLPDWVDPEDRLREVPTTTLLLSTYNAGEKWAVQQVSLFGQMTQIDLTGDGRGLALIEFFEAFRYPAEVLWLDWHKGTSERVFRQPNVAVTDVALTQAGRAYLAGYEPVGTYTRAPVPGRLKILSSDNLHDWKEMEVDYRAVARHAALAAVDAAHAWVATDTGMILQLVDE
jgi:hypothetical protein